MPPMPITQEEIRKLRRIYLSKYKKRISDQEAVDIMTRLVNVLIIIHDNE